ncbi:AAA family ATPase [Nocardia wallacei]|uniref:nSTAND1 domain-containing NTPase n=1 Tax=Nocardia wallacei TaxID=480035 RepID=UPI0024588C49|nr:AAA family ATPase [Nocardia wallacei]
MKSAATEVEHADTGGSARQEFARQLSALHRAAGAPSLRKVAMLAQQRADEGGGKGRSALASAQRISDWMSGRNVPAKFESLLPVLQVLNARARRRAGASGTTADLRAWRPLWAAARTAPVGRLTGTAPLYPGNGVYAQEHEAIFFGRQRALAALLELVRASASPHRSADVVVLTGASGVGKSSLLHAGLIPVLAAESGRWRVATMTPGPDRAHVLAQILSAGEDSASSNNHDAMSAQPSRRPLVVIDQFEKMFDGSVEPTAREDFLISLKQLCTNASVVISVRSDRLADCAQYPWLAHAIQHNGFRLNPMTRQELVSAIAGPPRTRGVAIEPGVVELLLNSLDATRPTVDRQQADPGVLAILHATMRSMWWCHTDERLSVADYRRIGGIEQTMRGIAEAAWAQLDPDAQTDARQILLALVTVHRDGTVDRRRLPGAELRRIATGTSSGEELVERLVLARLITIDYKHAVLVHDTLLCWDRLNAWISENRTALVWRHRIEEDAAEWDTADRDAGLLYRSVRLTAAVRHADPTLSAFATEFLRASARAELAAPEMGAAHLAS